jgi:cysteine desulfurase/selenocysteine lyase
MGKMQAGGKIGMLTINQARHQEFSESTARQVYLNHAGASPSPARVVRAVQEAVAVAGQTPMRFFMEIMRPAAMSARTRLAGLMGVPEEHLALVKNTGHALSIVADGLRLDPGDNVVMANCEYPAVVYPWYAQQDRGIETRLVSPRADDTLHPEDFAALMDERTRVLCLSWVEFGTGFRSDLAAFAQLAHDYGAIIVVDVIQALGALPLDAGALGLDVVATGSHKWLMAPAGTGGLFVAPHVLERMRLVNMGAGSVVDMMNFDPLVFHPKPTVQRYEEGSPNGLGLVGLNAALSLIEEVGIEVIAARVLALSGYAADALTRKGYQVTSPRAEAQRAGIVMFRHPSLDNSIVSAALDAGGVAIAVRGGKVRFSPHFYNTEEEIDRAVAVLPE